MRKALISAFMLVSTAVSLHAQTSSPDELNRRIIERRAFEAVVRGMPVVNYDLMVQEMLSTSGKVNQVIYWGRPLDSKNQTLTPDPDALYFIAFYNTKDGPIVLDLPPADDSGSFNANIVTVWQMPLEEPGRLGIDKGQGGKLLILPPDYKGTPPEGYAARQSDTFGGYMLFRANLKSHSAADVDASIAYGKKMKIYPLTQAANSPATVFTDVKDIDFDSTIRFDASVDERGMVYSYAFIGLKRLGAGQFYLISIRDKDGDSFDGAKTYRLNVPPNVPVDQYWSVTAYDRETHALIKNMPRASRSSQIPEMQKNADGSIDVYFGAKAPAGQESNWVPTDPTRKFRLMARFYGPKREFFDKVWKLPDVEKISAQ